MQICTGYFKAYITDDFSEIMPIVQTDEKDEHLEPFLTEPSGDSPANTTTTKRKLDYEIRICICVATGQDQPKLRSLYK